MKNIIETVVHEISTVLSNVDEGESLALADEIRNAKRIFISGEGRSGLMGKAIAMRLMHGGFHVYVTGETITPSIEKGDLLILISGSGSTSSSLQLGNAAKKAEAKVFLVTTNRDSKIAEISDGIVVVPAATKHRRPEEPGTIQPLGNQFDQSVHLLLDAIIISLTRSKDQQSTYEEMTNRHANLE
ncbi:6-phospho-3-hexuloisomerase [Desertibacillus haloalkaliphilus]|uniref:6-phospho-3-hexuloisomerase n=1 Tax=Desertibacillus haloalkaliphilus TaxID=1328930 RepID=UPI001C27DD65|nr:6-phospho-3-hexuloisomerase [Desertibacillus haloalkaliphilus]MBU8906682.1 6-phospho-3-hexuloisomerase [Desertibacillus haloalkaliphilus]